MPKTTQPVANSQQGKVNDSVDEYMRIAGRMLYEIILDWQKRQAEKKQSEQLNIDQLERRQS